MEIHSSSQIGENEEVSQQRSSQIGKIQEVSQKRIRVWNLSTEKQKKSVLDWPPLKDQLTADESRLSRLSRFLYLDRKRKENKALHEYMKKKPIDLKSFKERVQRLKEGESLYVFSFCFANIWSPEYKIFLLSLEDSFSRVYIGINSDLAGTLISENNEELRPDLHLVAKLLRSSDDLGVFITNKSEDEILKKLKCYEEFDYAEPGNTPMETLEYKKHHVLYNVLDNKSRSFNLKARIEAKRLFQQFQQLEVPVKWIGREIQLTEDYVVCERDKCVTDKASKILKLLHIKMLKYVVQPRCRWTVSSGKTCKFNNYYDFYPWTSWPSKV